MGANKNSSRRMNSDNAPNSQPRIPTRVCQGHVVTTDLPTLGTNPNSKQHGSATQEAKDLGNLRRSGRTIREAPVDSSHRGRRQSENQPRTSSTTPRKTNVYSLPADGPIRVNSPATLGGQSGKPLPTKTTQLDGSKQSDTRTREEHDEHLAEHHLTDGSHGGRGLSARLAVSNPSSTS
jgi:hypothetical protein